MTPRQWSRVYELFAKATTLDPKERPAFLKRACRNPEVRGEVESLLAQHDKGVNFPGVYSSVGGKVLSHYEIGEQIGKGGISIVYKARDARLQRLVALKVLQPWAMGHSRFRQLLIKEAQAASALNHPNIVTIHEAAEENGVGFIVMEYLAGKTLEAVIPRKGFPIRKALAYAMQIAHALSCAQEAGILHGDLKPLNVMVTGGDQTKLLDFGLAKALAAEKRQSKESPPEERLGTKPYMAPERLRNLRRDPDSRSEVFSFGLILHEMLRGEHAFGPAEHDALHLAIQTGAPHALPAKVPAALARIVQRCLDKNPKRRFASMAEVFYALKKCAGSKHNLEGILMRNPARPGSHTAQASARRHASAIRRARAKLERISYRNIARSQEALADLARILEDDPAPALRKIIVLGLKDVILNVEYGESVPRAPLRQMRRGVLDVMKKAVQGAVADHFKARELEHLDLYGMDFSGADLAGVSFQGCFLAEASFKRCRLAQASFAGAYIRNVDFAEADLSAVDLTGADWFNALSLSESQLRSARRETLLDCPADVRAMHRDLKNRYGFPFESWTAPVQEGITSAWRQYLRPGGLRDALIELQKHA